MQDLKNEIILYETTGVGSDRVKELWNIVNDILSIAECRGASQVDIMFEAGLNTIWDISSREETAVKEVYKEYQ